MAIGTSGEAREIQAICTKIKFIIPAVGLTLINRRCTIQFDSLIPMRLLLSLSQNINCCF